MIPRNMLAFPFHRCFLHTRACAAGTRAGFTPRSNELTHVAFESAQLALVAFQSAPCEQVTAFSQVREMRHDPNSISDHCMLPQKLHGKALQSQDDIGHITKKTNAAASWLNG